MVQNQKSSDAEKGAKLDKIWRLCRAKDNQ